MRHRRCISAILMSFVLFLQPAYAVPSEENQPENSQENNTENEKKTTRADQCTVGNPDGSINRTDHI